MKRKIALTILATALLVLSLFTYIKFTTATTVFQDGFEGDLSAYTIVTANTGSSVAIVNTQAYEGTHSLQCTANGYGAIAKAVVTVSPAQILYSRALLKINQLPQASAGRNLLALLSMSDTPENNGIAAAIHINNGNYYWELICAVNNYYTYYDEATPSNPQVGTWYEVQILRDVTNQKIDLWVNGINVVDVSGLSQTSATTLAKVGLDYVEYTNPTSTTGYFDAFTVSTDYIPLFGQPTPTPTPSPSPSPTPTATPTPTPTPTPTATPTPSPTPTATPTPSPTATPTPTPTPTATPIPTPTSSPTPSPTPAPLITALTVKANVTVTSVNFQTSYRLYVTINKSGVNQIEATIAKTTLPSITSLRFYINNVQKTFTYVDNGNVWVATVLTT
jgi:hypothetical protein